MAWKPRGGETVVLYDPTQRELYQAGRPSQYDPWAWPSEERGFLLFHYRGLLKKNHPAFRRMQEHFPKIDLNEVAEDAQRAKLERCRSGGGGDPDLFVFRPGSEDRFFVEAKDEDTLHCSQLVCFPIIEEHLGCVVKLVRIKPVSQQTGDA